MLERTVRGTTAAIEAKLENLKKMQKDFFTHTGSDLNIELVVIGFELTK